MANKYIDRVRTVSDNDLISFDDYDRRRALIFEAVKEAARQRFPVSNTRYMLDVEDLEYDKLDKPFSLREQKDAILGGRTLAKQLKGRFVLKDLDGNVIEKGAKRVIANVPYLTQRGTFIRNGNESVLINQMRMVPGAYSRKTNDGKFETFVNVRQGTGTQFKLQFDPETAVFDFRAGGRKIPAYPVLRALGVSDDDLKKTWGEDILNKNKNVNEKRALNSAYDVFVPKYKKEVKNEQTGIS